MLLEDSYGWVDDFRALPGEVGSEISRRIYLHSLMNQGTSLQQLKQMGFSREMVTDMNKKLIREEYGPKVGDLVKYKHTEDPAKFLSEWNDWHGVVTRIETVKMPGLPGWQTMCNIFWTNTQNGKTVTDYIAEKNLEVISKCK
jgi:hypothetical protein